MLSVIIFNHLLSLGILKRVDSILVPRGVCRLLIGCTVVVKIVRYDCSVDMTGDISRVGAKLTQLWKKTSLITEFNFKLTACGKTLSSQ
jgi:hypothetical protein